jgi:hypothetical protein
MYAFRKKEKSRAQFRSVLGKRLVLRPIYGSIFDPALSKLVDKPPSLTYEASVTSNEILAGIRLRKSVRLI